MKISITSFLLLAAGLTFMACNGDSGTPASEANATASVDSLFQKAKVFHDEVMPMMADVMRMSTRLDSLEGKADAKQIQSVKSSLQSADDAMTDWMAVLFKTDFKSMPSDSALQMLTKEMERGTGVKDSILTSLERAKKLIESSKQ